MEQQHGCSSGTSAAPRRKGALGSQMLPSCGSYMRRNRIRHVLQQMPTLPEQPPASTMPQHGVEGNLPSSSSSGGGGNGVGREESSSGAGVAPGSAPTIVDDILRLQRRCQVAAEQQRALGGALLRRAVLQTSAAELPCAPPKRQPRPDQRMTQAQLKQRWLAQQPWFLDWDKRLAQVGRGLLGGGTAAVLCTALDQLAGAVHSRRLPVLPLPVLSPAYFHSASPQVADALRPLRFALLDASCFAGQEEPVAVGALARILQAVAGARAACMQHAACSPCCVTPCICMCKPAGTALAAGRSLTAITSGVLTSTLPPACRRTQVPAVTVAVHPAAQPAAAWPPGLNIHWGRLPGAPPATLQGPVPALCAGERLASS